MDPFSMVVAIVLIGAVAGVAKEVARRGGGTSNTRILAELSALREEVKQLRQQNTDVVLNLDSAVDRLDRRVSHLEGGALDAGAEERARLTAGR